MAYHSKVSEIRDISSWKIAGKVSSGSEEKDVMGNFVRELRGSIVFSVAEGRVIGAITAAPSQSSGRSAARTAGRARVRAGFFFGCQIVPSQICRSKCTKNNYPARTGFRTSHVSPPHRTEVRISLEGPFLPCPRPKLRQGVRPVGFHALWG